nr:putative receptor-like protein kinase At4g00960 [Ipomoea trifida]
MKGWISSTNSLKGLAIASNPYGANLKSLLSTLSSHGNYENGFYTFTAGDDHHDDTAAHGLFGCRGDIPTADCDICVTQACLDILQLCPKEKTAISWYEKCMLRYSDGPVSGRAAGDDDRLATRVLCGKEQNRISQRALFMEWIGKTLEEMTNSLSGGGKKFGTHKGMRRTVSTLEKQHRRSLLIAKNFIGTSIFPVDVIGTSTGEFSQYDFAIIRAITNDFSLENKIGEGGYGSVYKGMLPIGQEVAVKRLSRSSRQGDQEFKNEAWEHWRDGSPLKILDPTLEKYYAENEVIQCMHIGLLCVQEYANDRLTMGEVMCMLNNYSANNWATPHEPAFYGNGSKRMPREIELEQSMTVNEVSISELYPR